MSASGLPDLKLKNPEFKSQNPGKTGKIFEGDFSSLKMCFS
jgi:hypothetical protein